MISFLEGFFFENSEQHSFKGGIRLHTFKSAETQKYIVF